MNLQINITIIPINIISSGYDNKISLIQTELIIIYTIIDININSQKENSQPLLNILNHSLNILSVHSIKKIIGNIEKALLNICKSIKFVHIDLSIHSITSIVKKYIIINRDIFALCNK